MENGVWIMLSFCYCNQKELDPKSPLILHTDTISHQKVLTCSCYSKLDTLWYQQSLRVETWNARLGQLGAWQKIKAKMFECPAKLNRNEMSYFFFFQRLKNKLKYEKNLLRSNRLFVNDKINIWNNCFFF